MSIEYTKTGSISSTLISVHATNGVPLNLPIVDVTAPLSVDFSVRIDQDFSNGPYSIPVTTLTFTIEAFPSYEISAGGQFIEAPQIGEFFGVPIGLEMNQQIVVELTQYAPMSGLPDE